MMILLLITFFFHGVHKWKRFILLGEFNFILGAIKKVKAHLRGIKNLGSQTIKFVQCGYFRCLITEGD